MHSRLCWWNGVAGIAALALWGCASPTQSSGGAASNAPAYVDFYVDSDDELSWFVARAGASDGQFKKVFYQISPLSGRVLRLPCHASNEVYKVTFMNRVVIDSPPIPVSSQPGKVTPVAISLAADGVAQVQGNELGVHATVRGGYRTRRLVYGPDQAYRLTAVAGEPVPVEPVGQMPYSMPTGN